MSIRGEVFDRGMAFVQLGYAGERVVKLLRRYAEGFRGSRAVQAHLLWRGERVDANTAEDQ